MGVFKTYFDCSQGQYIFDAYFSANYDSELSVTEHPVQTGANIADHAFMEPNVLTFEIGMSDVMSDVTGYTGFTGDATRSINAFKVLRKLQSDRIAINVVTKFGTYSNMMIRTISAVDSNATAYGLKATVTMRELVVASVTTVKISARAQKSDETNEGNQNVTQADESIASSLLD